MPRRTRSVPSLSLPALALAVLAFAAAGCDSSEAGDSIPDIAGSWAGAAALPNGFTVTMSLTQQGRAVSGTARLPNRSSTVIDGEVDASDRFVWEVQIGCEQWSGSLAIDDGARAMSGSINLDGGSCAPATSASGTLSLSR